MGFQTTRRAGLVAIAAGALVVGGATAALGPPHRAVQVLSTAQAANGRGCSAIGSGLAVGRGLVLTAAHVLLQPADLSRACGFADTSAQPRVDVTLGAGPHTAVVLAQGARIDVPRMHFAGAGDYAILRIAVPMHSRPLAPCAGPAAPGRRVTILTRGGALPARVAEPQTRKSGDDAGYVDLDRVVVEGDSGSGVLDAATGCVLGVVSHRFPEPTPTVTRMVPVDVFADAWAHMTAR